jgi:8-oxo-dGTP pyrophosphatase MutT (NUDIX family)
MRAVTDALDRYEATWLRQGGFGAEGQRELLGRMRAFTAAHPDALLRTQLSGHLTGSALVTDPERERVLLTLHRKLGLWLQLGGHADGEPALDRVALREAVEESGLERLSFLDQTPRLGPQCSGPAIFDLDIHPIPARGAEPRHLHYDVRFVLVAEEPNRIAITAESDDLRWFTLAEAYRVTTEPSMHRQFDKLAFLR